MTSAQTFDPGSSFPPGSRVRVRGEEWAVEKCLPLGTGGYAVHVQGLTDLVRHHKAIFLTTLDSVEALRPEDTQLVQDQSAGYRQTRLYLETLLRRTPPTDTRLHLGHRGALDLMPYQIVPVQKALEGLHPRILIADGVGLGKTVEVGMLLAELIKRGRGRRILVVVIKSLLAQFQRELWARFAIPVVRLDSEGIARVQAKIPANRNPFSYFDRVIVSVDTLKNNARYRAWLEQTRWDVIVVDECHNVANRGSQREALARLLAATCESLILTSATPHNGRPESFANLMRMLDPAAVADEKNFTREEVEHLFVRRFKKDIEGQASFTEREVHVHETDASPAEAKALAALRASEIHNLGRKHHAVDPLFRWTLIKAFLSSPQACVETLQNRIARTEEALADDDKGPHPHAASLRADIDQLRELEALCGTATPSFSKLAELIRQLRAVGFTGKPSSPRVIVFSERLETLRVLDQELRRAFEIPDGSEAVDVFSSGELSDIDQRRIIEAFGKKDSPLRLLLASDAASEGVNLHYHCNQLFHFDIPWSIIRLTQRMGRIDRFGQKQTPHLHYVLTRGRAGSADEELVHRLIGKEQQVHAQLGDAGSLLGLYDAEAEEDFVLQGLARGEMPNEILPDVPRTPTVAGPVPQVDDDEEAHMAAPVPAPAELDLLALLDGDGGAAPALQAFPVAAPVAVASIEDVDGRPEMDLLAFLEDAARHAPPPPTVDAATAPLPSLFADDYELAVTALRHVEGHPVAGPEGIQWDADDGAKALRVHAPVPFREHNEPFLPAEAVPEKDEPYRLVSRREVIQEKIQESLEGEGAWPEWHLLWELHPLVEWLLDSVASAYARHEAPIVVAPKLGKGRAVYLFSARVSNQASQAVYAGWYGVPVEVPKLGEEVWPLDRVLAETGFRAGLSNTGQPSRMADALAGLVPVAVARAREQVAAERAPGLNALRKRVRGETRRLEQWAARVGEIVNDREVRYRVKHGTVPTFLEHKLRSQRDSVQRFKQNHAEWLKGLEAHGEPYLRLAAVFAGE